MRTHELKIWPEYFVLVMNGQKTAELRYNDRDFAEDDLILFREWDGGAYTERYCYCLIRHVAKGCMVPSDWVLLSIVRTSEPRKLTPEDRPCYPDNYQPSK